MTTYRVLNTGSGGDGSNWTTQAITTLKAAVEGCTADGDIVLVDKAHVDVLAADTTITAPFDISIICVDSAVSDSTLATGALIGSQATNYAITLAGAKKVYVRGLEFKNGTSTASKNLIFAATDGGHFEFESVKLTLGGTSTASRIVFGASASPTLNAYIKLTGCEFAFNSTAQRVSVLCIIVDMNGCTVNATSAPATLIAFNGLGSRVLATGCDLSAVTGALFNNPAGVGSLFVALSNCKIGAAPVSMFSTLDTVLNKGSVEMQMYNCATADTHFGFAHFDAFGSTVASATIYANDGAKFDGTNGVSLKIETTGNCSFFTPYVSPWIDKYNAGGTEITPRLECFRDGSTAIYDNTQVWSELSYQGTSGSTKAEIVSNRAAPLASGSTTGRTSTLTHSSWETGTSADVAFKLDHGAVTPAEIGHLRMRVCVGATEVTDLYVDGKVRL